MRSKIVLLMLAILSFALFSGCKHDETSDLSASFGVVDATGTKLFDVTDESLYESIDRIIEDDDLSLSPLDGYDFMLLSENGRSGKLAIYSFSQEEAEKAVSRGNQAASEWVGNVKAVELSTYASDTQAAARNGIYIRALIGIFTPGAEEFVENALGIYGGPSGEATENGAGFEITVDTVTYSYFPENVSFRVEPSDAAIPAAIRPE